MPDSTQQTGKDEDLGATYTIPAGTLHVGELVEFTVRGLSFTIEEKSDITQRIMDYCKEKKYQQSIIKFESIE